MLTSNALILSTIFFAFFAIFSMFYGVFMTQLKLEDTSQYNFLTQDSNSPWFKPKTKVIMLVVDALRLDYLIKFENDEHNEKLRGNKFKKLNQLFAQEPEKFVLVPAISDVPTFTILRTPCLMTGNIPRKSSIMTSLGALSSEEDSIPRQIRLNGKKIWFAGDNTIYKYQFLRV